MPLVFKVERTKTGQFKKGYKHPFDRHTTIANICPCGIKFACITHPKKRGRRVYQKVKYHSKECRSLYSNSIRIGKSMLPN